MTKLKNVRAKSTQHKMLLSESVRLATRKFAPRSQPQFKHDQRNQPGRRWNQKNRDFGWSLSYESSQRKTETQGGNFSSFFAPSASRPVEVELGLLIRKHWVGGLIGKKGKTIWNIRNQSKGANIDFGNDDIFIDRSKDGKWEQSPWPNVEQEKYTVCAISGSKEQATEAAKAIAEQIAKAAQSTDYRLEFLIPDAYVGIFIGKKGVNLKQMKGPAGEDVSINIRDEPILLGNNRTTLCTLFGPAESMRNTVERTANWLGDISIRVLMDRELKHSRRPY